MKASEIDAKRKEYPMIAEAMQRTRINGVELDLFDRGGGEPVLFIHGGGSIECHAVLQEPALTNEFRLIHFHRRGYGTSELPEPDVSFAKHATDCKAVLDHLGIDQAHVVGESVGGSILLQFAVDYPDRTRSLALLEPVLPSVIGDSPEVSDMLGKVNHLYHEGDVEVAIDTFFREVSGADYRSAFDRTFEPGWFEQLLGDAQAMFEVDGAALNDWAFGREDASTVSQPVLNMTGSQTRSFFRACHAALKSWIPHAENIILPDSTHCMLETNPGESASRLAEFFSRHSISETSGTATKSAHSRSV